MGSHERLRAEFAAAVRGAEPGLAAADRLCHACVDLLQVDGAAISLVRAGATQGTFGSSNALSRRLDEYQFTFGEGPCLDSVRQAHTIQVPDLADPSEARWPAYAGAALEEGVHAVYAVPVAINSTYVGALDLFRSGPGALAGSELTGALLAAELAALPLLDLMSAEVDWAAIEAGDPWLQLASLERVEVYQATGMIVARLDVDPTEALVRLRAHAFAHGMTASAAAWAVVNRELVLDADNLWSSPTTESDSDSGGLQ
ncbi:MAG TPA: ANTAR domain-containing protein [Sporichthya sp.]|nr:ANTAR domain-containing protein [Sporichthya sp.]